MRVMFLGLIAAVSASAMTPVPAEAQRWRDHRGWHDGRYWHEGRYHYAPRGYGRGRGWEGRRWRGRGSRTVCRWRNSRYGERRVCYRVRR